MRFIFLLCLSFILACNTAEVRDVETFEYYTESNKQEDFDEFILKFKNDTAFQLSRIVFPLKGIYLTSEMVDYDRNESGETTWTKDTWNCIHNIDKSEIDNFIIEKEMNDTVVNITTSGKNFGFHFVEKYKLVKGKWYLVYVEDVFI